MAVMATVAKGYDLDYAWRAVGEAYRGTPRGSQDGKRAALAGARKIIRRACHILTELGDDAFTTG